MEKKKIWELDRPDIDSYRDVDKIPVTIVVDNVRSLNNIGSLFRTADAFLIKKIVLCGISATPPSIEIHKTALGAEESVLWEYYSNTLDALRELRDCGVIICTLEQVKGSIPLNEFVPKITEQYAIVVGNEVDGVQQEVVDYSDYCIEIPQFGTKHSLNVTVSAALAMWQFFKVLKL